MAWGLIVSLTMFWLACEAAIVWLVKRLRDRQDRQNDLGNSLIEESMMTGNLNFLAMAKDSERYVFLYDDDHAKDVLRTFGRFASNPELSFTWYDAATLSLRVRQLMNETQQANADETPAANRRF